MSEKIKQYWSVDFSTNEVNHTAIQAHYRGGMYHIPKGALEKEPLLQKKGFAVIAILDKSGKAVDSEYIEDHRGTTIYDESDCTKYEVVSELGPIKAGFTADKPLTVFDERINANWVTNIEKLRTAKYEAVNEWRNQQEASDVQVITVDGVKWDADPSSRERIVNTLASSFVPPFWTDADNNDQPITETVLRKLHTEIIEQGFKIHARQREMKKEIALLDTVEEVKSYEIGWPI